MASTDYNCQQHSTQRPQSQMNCPLLLTSQLLFALLQIGINGSHYRMWYCWLCSQFMIHLFTTNVFDVNKRLYSSHITSAKHKKKTIIQLNVTKDKYFILKITWIYFYNAKSIYLRLRIELHYETYKGIQIGDYEIQRKLNMFACSKQASKYIQLLVPLAT